MVSRAYFFLFAAFFLLKVTDMVNTHSEENKKLKGMCFFAALVTFAIAVIYEWIITLVPNLFG